jgi:hypothetical protein
MLSWAIHPETLPFAIAWDAWATLAVGIAAVAGAYRIGSRQVKTSERQTDIQRSQVEQSRLQLRAELYERRILAYSAIRDYAAQSALGNELPTDVQKAFFEALNASRFLFGPNIQDWIRQVYAAATQLRIANARATNPHTAGTDRTINAIEAGHDRLNALLTELDERFAPYLGFEEAA